MAPKETQEEDNFLEGDDVSLLRQIEAAATAPSDELFASLVSHLADILQAGYALVADVIGDSRVRSLALREPRGFGSAIEWDTAGFALRGTRR